MAAIGMDCPHVAPAFGFGPGIGSEIDLEFMVAEVARLWSLCTGKTKLWRVRLHRANAGIISAAILNGQICRSSWAAEHAPPIAARPPSLPQLSQVLPPGDEYGILNALQHVVGIHSIGSERRKGETSCPSRSHALIAENRLRWPTSMRANPDRANSVVRPSRFQRRGCPQRFLRLHNHPLRVPARARPSASSRWRASWACLRAVAFWLPCCCPRYKQPVKRREGHNATTT